MHPAKVELLGTTVSSGSSAPTKRLLSVTEAAQQIGVSRSHLYSLRKSGLIKFSKLLGKTVVPQTEIDRLVASVEGQEGA